MCEHRYAEGGAIQTTVGTAWRRARLKRPDDVTTADSNRVGFRFAIPNQFESIRLSNRLESIIPSSSHRNVNYVINYIDYFIEYFIRHALRRKDKFAEYRFDFSYHGVRPVMGSIIIINYIIWKQFLLLRYVAIETSLPKVIWEQGRVATVCGQRAQPKGSPDSRRWATEPWRSFMNMHITPAKLLRAVLLSWSNRYFFANFS